MNKHEVALYKVIYNRDIGYNNDIIKYFFRATGLHMIFMVTKW